MSIKNEKSPTTVNSVRVSDSLIIDFEVNLTKFDIAMMETAHVWANLSHANRKKVGCIIAKDNRIISHGYNGNPQQLENECEENGKTKSTTLHAEENAFIFAAKHGISVLGATMYCTCLPCKHCAALILQSGITTVFYEEDYISATNGSCKDLLQENGVKIIQFSLE